MTAESGFGNFIKRGRRAFYRRLHAIAANSRKFRRVLYYLESRLLLAAVKSGEHYVVNTADKTVGRACYVDLHACDSEKLQMVRALLPDTHTKELLIDAGANIGTICIHAVYHGLFEKAVAIEPEPGNFRLLRANVALNGLEDKITTVNAALGARDGETLDLELSQNNHGDHRIRPAGGGGGLFNEDARTVIQVRVSTIGALAPGLDKNSALIWMDTQGYEGFVLEGAAEAVKAGVPLCMEFWPYALKRAGAYAPLMAALSASPYEHLVDLERPDEKTAFSVENLEKIANRLGDTGAFTDVLIW